MEGSWRFWLDRLAWFVVLFVGFSGEECLAVNHEVSALMEFRAKVEVDPHGVFANWNAEDGDPCWWSGVRCDDGKVEMLDLSGLSLKGTLAPEIGKLGNLRAILLNNNSFFGDIPKEIGELTLLEILDLRANNLSGKIPAEIGQLPSLKHLILHSNRFEDAVPSNLEELNMLAKMHLDRNDTFAVETEFGSVSRKVGRISQNNLQKLKKAKSFMIPLKHKVLHFLELLPHVKIIKSHSCGHKKKHGVVLQSINPPHFEEEERQVHFVRRRLLQENINLPAIAIVATPIQEDVDFPSLGSGSFPAVQSSDGSKSPAPSPKGPSSSVIPNPPPPGPGTTVQSANHTVKGSTSHKGLAIWMYILIGFAVFVFVIGMAGVLVMTRSRGAAAIGPWKTGLSGQLQKAFVSGVPKLNRGELEAACEDFSNIIQSYPEFTVFKGTLSSGVEIAVASTIISSSKDWSKRSEAHFRKKVDRLSRINHKNFVNLLGYCEEEEPFMRMMVFEYAPNGTLSEHLHVKELEHLDWGVRMRIIMGITYCLQYMHHELNPPLSHPNLQSSSIFLTDDYAAKIVELDVWKEVISKKLSGDEDMDSSVVPLAPADPGSNVYDFGVLLLEIISGKPSYSEEHGSIVNWASECLNGKCDFSFLTDPTLKTFKNNELNTICEIIKDCIHQDPKKRPNMKEVTIQLREVLGISPDSATPRLSPLWWAELEILSVETS